VAVEIAQPKSEVKKRRQSKEHKQSQVDDDACTQYPHSEHEQQGKKTEPEYPTQQAPSEEHEKETHLHNLHERYE
jgi:hypothetical protein